MRMSGAARVLRLARTTRGVRLVKVVASINRGMRALGATMGHDELGDPAVPLETLIWRLFHEEDGVRLLSPTAALKGTYKARPQRSELPSTINESLVVELYSK